MKRACGLFFSYYVFTTLQTFGKGCNGVKRDWRCGAKYCISVCWSWYHLCCLFVTYLPRFAVYFATHFSPPLGKVEPKRYIIRACLNHTPHICVPWRYSINVFGSYFVFTTLLTFPKGGNICVPWRYSIWPKYCVSSCHDTASWSWRWCQLCHPFCHSFLHFVTHFSSPFRAYLSIIWERQSQKMHHMTPPQPYTTYMRPLKIL
jgi:hypothetical protein